ncbi:MAG TPA: pseudouridine-5'-phosphate glycosidase [Jatrophihabitans sp.]|nr:pseudouridine-5'-phosphate glycosidase [Jatrophihabitans sp.]
MTWSRLAGIPHAYRMEDRDVQLHPEVAAALAAGRPVVALESTIISHGLPRPDNYRIARQIEQSVRDAGALPATVAIVHGQPRIGLDDAALRAITGTDEVAKVSVRDLATVAARGGLGATTVAATAHLAARAGIAVFATGALGGVHRQARDSWDESADLTTLAGTGITVRGRRLSRPTRQAVLGARHPIGGQGVRPHVHDQ